MTEIVEATTTSQLNHVRTLIRQFTHWHRERHVEDIELINEYFDKKDFEMELASLPGKYSRPNGRLLLALYDGQPAGCVALRMIDLQTCEMKRMFVDPPYRGKGVGQALTQKLLYAARTIGYSSIKLDTSIRQVEALRLYANMGFHRIEAYYPLPKKLEDWLVFMELVL